MANTKISQLTPNTNPTGNEELVYAYNNANGKMSLSTMKTFANTGQQAALVSWVNIKTINNQSILWSGNLDVSWWGGGSWQPTELGGDANIWELSEWVYVTTYDLYYKSGEKVNVYTNTWSTHKQMMFVTQESTWGNWFFVFNVSQYNSVIYNWRASFWYSISSSVWECYRLWDRQRALNEFKPVSISVSFDSFSTNTIVQVCSNMKWIENLRISPEVYPWLTYTIYIDSVMTWETYTIWLWNWVTNPLWITLPTASTKKCVVTVLMTSSSTWIVTGCTIEP